MGKERMPHIFEFYGQCENPVHLSNTHSDLLISSREGGRIHYENSGLVVSFNGGERIPDESSDYKSARDLSKLIVKNGGIVMGGGRKVGVMKAIAEGGGESSLGVVIPAQVRGGNLNETGSRLVVDGSMTRLNLLTIAPPAVVVYPGGIGTLHELANALIMVKNQSKYGTDAPTILADAWWQEHLQYLQDHDLLKPEFAAEVKYFSSAAEAMGILQEKR